MMLKSRLLLVSLLIGLYLIPILVFWPLLEARNESIQSGMSSALMKVQLLKGLGLRLPSQR